MVLLRRVVGEECKKFLGSPLSNRVPSFVGIYDPLVVEVIQRSNYSEPFFCSGRSSPPAPGLGRYDWHLWVVSARCPTLGLKAILFALFAWGFLPLSRTDFWAESSAFHAVAAALIVAAIAAIVLAAVSLALHCGACRFAVDHFVWHHRSALFHVLHCRLILESNL